MLVSAIPFTASAAEPIALTVSNVTTFPVAEFIHDYGAYVGMTVGDSVTLKGGEVRYDVNGDGTLADDEVVPGKFEIQDPSYIPNMTGGTNMRVSFDFIPDDQSAYTGFNARNNRNVQYLVQKTTPVPVDENDTEPVATEVEAGSYLSASTLSGAQYKNPYNPSHEKILNASWVWDESVNSSTQTVVNESGYYAARLLCTGYETMTAQVYVKVKGNAVATEIIEAPTFENLELGKKWSDVVAKGGKTVVKGGTEEVAGTYSITKIGDYMGGLNFNITAGEKKIEVTFKPNDSEKYLPSTTIVTVNVEKPSVKFVDSEGKEIVPEIELGYNTKDLQYNLSEIKNLLKPYANCGEENFYCNWQDLENKDLPYRTDSLEVNTTKEYIIRGLSYDSDNYAPAMLTFKLKVVPRKLTATVRYTGNSISVDTTKPLTDKLYGTFEYYANGEKVGTSQITTTTDSTGLPWKPEKSGVYDITVKFVPDEKDVYYFDDTTVEDMEIICAWGVTVENGTVKVSNSYKENGSFKYGEDVSVQSKTNASFSHWIVTDTKGNEIEIEGFDKNKSGNTFKMPDFSVNFKAIDLTQRKITCVNCFVKNAVGSADAPIRYKGQKVSIGIDEAALPLEKFAGWEITDSNGNAYMPEGLTEEALAGTNIEFTMPDFDITVKAKNVDDEKGDGFFAQVKAFFENLFNGETECPVLKWIIKVFNVIVNFFTGLFVK